MNSFLPQVRTGTIEAACNIRDSSGPDYFQEFWKRLREENPALANEVVDAFTFYEGQGTQIEHAVLHATLYVLNCLDLQWQLSSEPIRGRLPRLWSTTISTAKKGRTSSRQYMWGLIHHFRTCHQKLFEEIHNTRKNLVKDKKLTKQDVVTMTILHILICISSETELDPASFEA